MLDFSHIPTGWNSTDIQVFTGAGVIGECWQTWQKPRGKKMATILLVGKGGNGGNGVIGAASTAAGGGGGGSGGQTTLTMPLFMIPDILYLTLPGVSATTGLHSYVSIAPKLTAGAGAPLTPNTLVAAYGGSNGGNASGATAGSAGTAAPVMTAGDMSLGWAFVDTALAGQAGIIGGTTSSGGSLTLPLTGLMVTGGTGGGGLTASGVGSNGGQISSAGVFPSISGGALGGQTTTSPPQSGQNGIRPVPNLFYGMGGGGGGSTHATATGAGLVQSSGGDGAPGCGGGGSGGALTGSSAGRAGLGGPAFCVIVVW